ncbi:ABC transporter substrate-binding protein [Thalassomonas sp. RHCl1]|uniref:ABC transporter substrate-binding protein n=1 Tax=Thalassomonas sp. RHCl1 TaxID=2995320 RepID=UPI00248B3CBD|nr:ABC transporter substrate-binding protein [Thalassomonas sp. RHCl1]
MIYLQVMCDRAIGTLHPLLAGLLLLGLTACGQPEVGTTAIERTATLRQNYAAGKDIDIALVWHKDKKQFRDGAILAAEEINAEGGIDGHQLRLHFTEASSFLKSHHVDRAMLEGRYRNAKQVAGADIAHRVVARNNVSAVISADIPVESTLSSMVVYKKHGVLFLNAGSSYSSIDWVANDLYFQLLPPNTILADNIAAEIKQQKWQTVFIVYLDTYHETEVIELLRTELVNDGITLSGSYAMQLGEGNLNRGYQGRLRASLAELRYSDTDAIILLMPPKLAAHVIHFTREIGVLQPFLGSREFNSPKEFIDIVGEHGIGTRTTSLYRAGDYQVKRFEEKFNQRFTGSKANVSAMLGYDSVRLYAQGVASAKTVVPIQVSEALNYRLPVWFGLLGSYSFNEGESVNINYSILQLVSRKDGTLGFVAENDAN